MSLLESWRKKKHTEYLRKLTFPAKVINCLLLLSQELGPLEDLQYDNFVWRGLMRICAGKHNWRYCFPLVLLSCGFYNLYNGPYTIVISEPQWEFGDVDGPFKAEHSIDIYFLNLDKLWVSVKLNNYTLHKEKSLLRSEIYTSLWGYRFNFREQFDNTYLWLNVGSLLEPVSFNPMGSWPYVQ